MKEQRAKAECLRALHHRLSPLVLPNAWDVITARIFEVAGFPAVGTTSAGMAAALGYADGSYLPMEVLEPALRRMVEAVQVPITADIEAGYGRTTQETVDNVHQLIDTGIAGINIQDFSGNPQDDLISIEFQVERITAIRNLAVAVGIPLFINARIDTVFHSGLQGRALMDDIFRRARRYQEAGADCIFVVGVPDGPTIQKLAQGISGPLNIMVGPGVPSVMELASLGVARISIGPTALLRAMAAVKRFATELFTTGTYDSGSDSAMSYQELNQYFSEYPNTHEDWSEDGGDIL